MTNPFDDPKLRAFMRANGIRHTPGMADEMMRELAPLLKEEGVDLDDLSGVDVEQMNTALAAATERRNMMLSTPVGAQRDGSLALLRDIAEAIERGDVQAARDVVGSIAPDSIGDMPSVAQVTGVAAGLLDDWNRDPSTRPRIVGATPAKAWPNRAARTVAADLLALATKGRAFGSLTSLTAKHRGLAVLEGSAVAVAAAISRWARSAKSDVAAVAREALTSADAPRPAASESAFRRPAPAMAPHEELFARFSTWLASQDYSDDDFEEALDGVSWLIAFAAGTGFDLSLVDDAWQLLDHIETELPADLGDSARWALDDWVHFQLDVSSAPEAWDDLHLEIEDAVSGQADVRSAIAAALAHGEEVPDDERRAAAARTRIVSAVRDLLDWIGSGRAITTAGGSKRADIAHLAGLLGIRAEGVDTLPPDSWMMPRADDDQTPSPELDMYSVQSMFDVPVLTPWWDTLVTCEVLTRLKTRIKPGSVAEVWLSEDLPPLEEAENVITFFVATLLTEPLRRAHATAFAAALVTLAIRHLTGALAVDAPTAVDAGGTMNPPALREVERLANLGLVERSSGGYVVPPALRLSVARGVALANTVLNGGLRGD